VSYEIVALSDVHLEPDTPVHPSYWAATKFVKDLRPKHVVIIGDFADFQCFSQHHNKNKPLLLEGKRYRKTWQLAREHLERIRPWCTELHYIEGNHEYWTRRYVEKHPEMEGHIDWKEDFGLDEMQIGVTDFNDILTLGRINFTHGWYCNKYHARKHLDEMGDHLFYGHTHGNQREIRRVRARQEPYIAESIACLCSKNPSYLRNRQRPYWINGFLHIEVWDSEFFTPHFIPIINGAFSFGGTVWRA
jgi:predicted phosphodiesterase